MILDFSFYHLEYLSYKFKNILIIVKKIYPRSELIQFSSYFKKNPNLIFTLRK